MKKKLLNTATVETKTHSSKKDIRFCYQIMTLAAVWVSISNMSARHVIIALAVLVCAGAMLFAVDYQSLTPQSANLFAVR